MSDDAFLSRWSRRKLDANQPSGETENKDVVADQHAPQPVPDAAGEESAKEIFDVSKLPSLDSIGAATDITPFLQKGVPVDLQRAALRRAWSADPAIRDFIGLAENAWDFNDPNAMPGFGPLDATPEQVREMVARAFGEFGNTPAADAEESASLTEPQVVPELASQPSDQERVEAIAPEAVAEVELPSANEPEPSPEPVVRRTHGGALPT